VDKSGVIINESTMRAFGWDRENVLGKKVDYFKDSYKVIGVVSDFHNRSLRHNISPIAFFHINSNMWLNSRRIAIKFKPEHIKSLLSKLETQWKGITETTPFTYSFLDENLAREYQAEEQIGQLFTVFTVLALIIACIGLFGLASYIATQRSKEIGVRKVLGASTKGLVIMLNKDFTKLVIVSILIATPVSLWMMNQWLEQFANKINIGWSIFLVIGASVLFISWVTVAFHSVKTAMLNPAKILKDE
jgi:putative ABC transport system permease protein